MTTIANPRVAVHERRRFAAPPWVMGLIRGRAEDAAWVRPAFAGVTLLAAVLYLWNLTISGYANTYYSAAALAASQDWKALDGRRLRLRSAQLWRRDPGAFKRPV